MRFSLKKRRVLILVLIGIFVIVILNFFQKEVRTFFYSISSPIQKVFWQTGDKTSDFLEGIFKIKDLKNEADNLKLKNQELLFQVVFLKEIEKENKILRESLNLNFQKEFKLSMAQIISKDISQDFILINKGTKDGIFKDMPVITSQKSLVGKVSGVYKNFSKVELSSSKKSSFDAKIQKEENDIFGLIKGKGNSKLSLVFIPQEEEIFQNDIVLTSSLGGIFPKGLLVGQVKKVEKSDLEPFQKIEISPFFDISQIEILFIILDF